MKAIWNRWMPWLLLSFVVWGTHGAEPEVAVRLWPGMAPGDESFSGEEQDTTKPSDNLVADRRVVRLGGVSDPTLTVYRPSADIDTGAAVLVFPGGGYHILAMDLEGTEVCEWLNSLGVTAVLVKYRVPRREDRERYAAPLQDAQRALGMVRHRAMELGIDPERIGVLGFSAGGHLAATLSTNHASRTYEPMDAADAVSCRPDFTVLVYPGYLVVREEGDRVSPELEVTEKTPPTFLVMAQDDGVRVENALFYYLALKRAGVPSELHVYATGGHGYGLRRTGELVTTWPDRVADWMRSNGWLNRE
jgi:acetyl esterase/lipase